MAQIGTLAANAETVLNLQFLPEFLVIGSISSTEDYTVESIISGKSRIVATDGLLNRALNSVQNAGVADRASVIQPLANGGKGDVTVQLRIFNPAATPIALFGASTGKNDGTVITRSTSQIDANSNQEYKNFDKLAFRRDNVQSVQIEWVNGWSDRFTPSELAAILAKMTPYLPGSSGIVDPVVVLDNSAGIFKSVRVYSTSSPIVVLREGTELI